MGNLLLTALVFLPVAGALGLLLVPKSKVAAAKGLALATSLAVLALAGWLWAAFDPAGGFQFGEDRPWIVVAGLKIRYALAMDGLALPLCALTALLTPICLLASWRSITDRVRGYLAAFLLLETGMMGVFLARDLFLFYVFWEAMLVPMLLIIGVWGGARRIYASVKFMIYTIAGSIFMLVAVLSVYFEAGNTFDIGELPGRLAHLSSTAQVSLFLAFTVAFAIKVPLFPFHTWLPDAHVEAPTAGSVILAGVLLKMGAYGLMRFSIPFFPGAAHDLAGLMNALAVISIIFGALMSICQSDMKKLIAYSSVSHLGFVVLGIFSFTTGGTQGAVLQMVNHGLSTGALFLLVGVVYDRTHKRGLDDFGGLAGVTPAYATAFLLATLASIGLPGLNGFAGEFLVLKGAFDANRGWAAAAALGVILGAVYMLKMYRDVFWGPVTTSKNRKLGDLDRFEVATLAPLVALCVVLGLFPGLVLTKTEASVKAGIPKAVRAEVSDVRR